MFRRLAEKLEGFNLHESKAKKGMKEIKRFIETLGLEELSAEEIAFYNQNLVTNESMRHTILQILASTNGIDISTFQTYSSRDFDILNVMVAKYLMKHDNQAIGELLLSNRGTGIVDYDVEDVFEIIKRNYMEGLDDEVAPVMNQLMSIIKPIVVKVCITSREIVLYNDDSNGQEIILQPRDVTVGLMSILLGEER